jgi:hypothetical protein
MLVADSCLFTFLYNELSRIHPVTMAEGWKRASLRR